MALLLPAVQKIREASNKMQCACQLRQLGIAAHNFHNDHNRLPPGYLGPDPARNADFPAHLQQGQWIGHLPLLLPYLEQDGVFKQLQVDFNPQVVTTLPWFWRTGPISHQENYMAGQTRLAIFRCPSAPRYEPQPGPGPFDGGTMLGLHVFNSPSIGAFTCGWKDDYVRSANYRFLATTNYLGVAGCGVGTHSVFGQYEGLCTNRSRHSLGQVSTRDGTSNTLMYGEAAGTQWHSGPETKDIAWMAGGGLGTYLGLQRARTAPLITFSSWHTAGVQFCFADGSVRTVRFGNSAWDERSPFTSDWYLLQQLAGYKDGQAADVSALLD
jgi:hypothetical protein